MSARSAYGGSIARPATGGGGVVARVEPDSPAARAGIAPGERILTANGRVLTDVIAWCWESDTASVTATVAGSDEAIREVVLTRGGHEAWGIDFAAALFDEVHTCRNRCAFCFMSQLPRGLRRALYVRDDDYRLSFLSGNFITLTNLSDDDITRITTEHLSPLHVSLHAITPAVRERLVCAREDRGLDRFDELVEAGIDLHVQIVLVPGENDRDELKATLSWLAAREGVLSVGIVPLGFTAHQNLFSSSYEHPDAAASVLDAIAPWATAMRDRDGVGWVYAADEFYLTAGRDVPSAAEYDSFPQYENGIGLVRSFIDDFYAAPTSDRPPSAEQFTLVTGTMFAPVLAGLLEAAGFSSRVSVLPVENRFFGGNVGVTGLLAVVDIASAVREGRVSGSVLVPDVVFNDDGLTLDDLSAAELRQAAGVPLAVLATGAQPLRSAIL